ncbi:MAG TPA: hypothetical protein VFQ20_01875 [Burkholderiaceae bacterium]|nr:hypothetical protein [Burkholderiaceae bacterium]
MLAALLLTFGGTASAAGIADTKHNLGANSTAGNNKTTDTAEVCVFCHTPHGADTNAPVPLWNKRLGANGAPAGGGTYTSYATLQTPSLDGTIAEVGSISMACLSCHDGTQAMDNIINAPGSGGYDATGGGNDGRTYTWTGATVNGAGRLSSGIAALGTDLSNDHPIGIQYCGGGLSGSGSSVTGTCKDGDFKPLLTAVINSNQIFWVETGTADNAKTRTDLPLYQRNPNTLGPLVECASCHDPHVKQGETGPNGQVAGETFLRISNASSAVCTACHVK